VGSFKLRVIEPCRERWAGLTGDARERFCARCATIVHNLSALTEEEARRAIDEGDGRRCVRFLSRADGTVVFRRRARWPGRAARAVGTALLAIVFWTGVVLVQRPWHALARKLAGVPPAAPPLQAGADIAPGLPIDLLDPPRPPRVRFGVDPNAVLPSGLYETMGTMPSEIPTIVDLLQNMKPSGKE